MSKGTRRERECVEAYQKAGWATYRPATVRFGENDMFGLFDLLSVSPDHCNPHAVQVKSNQPNGVGKWSGHTALFRRLGWKTMYAVPIDGEGWVLFDPEIDPEDGRRTCGIAYDEREDGRVDPDYPDKLNIGEGLTEYLKS